MLGELLSYKKFLERINEFSPKQITNFISEVLVLGVVLENDEVVLLQPDREVPLGYKVS